MAFRKSLKNRILPFALALVIGIGSGCAGARLEKRVKEISSQTMTLPNVYPAQVNRLFSEIGNVYGNEFVRELKQLPDMKENYTPKKIKALQDIYSVGKEIENQNSPYTHRLIEDIVKAGADTPTTTLISVPLREWYRMHLNGKWDVKDAMNTLERCNYIYKYPLTKEHSGILNFLSWTNWENFNDEDWKKWEKMGNEYVVLFKKDKDYLIKNNQEKRLRYIPDSVDYAKAPEKTREDGGGDCEEFAIEAAYDMEVLEKAGLYDDVQGVNIWNRSNKKGHSFLSYKKNNEGGVFTMDNARREGIKKFDSIIIAGKQIAKECGFEPTHIWAYDWRTFYSRYANFPYSDSLI